MKNQIKLMKKMPPRKSTIFFFIFVYIMLTRIFRDLKRRDFKNIFIENFIDKVTQIWVHWGSAQIDVRPYIKERTVVISATEVRPRRSAPRFGLRSSAFGVWARRSAPRFGPEVRPTEFGLRGSAPRFGPEVWPTEFGLRGSARRFGLRSSASEIRSSAPRFFNTFLTLIF